MTYLDRLREYSKKKSRPVETYSPLAKQIQALIAPLSPLQLHRAWSVEELLPQLKGRFQARPATREVAKALRQIGWTQKRCWKKSGMNRRFWYPPAGG
jgi:hypothetical protein